MTTTQTPARADFYASEPPTRKLTIADHRRLDVVNALAQRRQISRSGWYVSRIAYEFGAGRALKGVAIFTQIVTTEPVANA